MPRSYDQKLKLLYIRDYLQRNSHVDHPINATELIEMLQDHEIKCERKTIYSDIKALQEYGMDIVSLQGAEGGYYVASRNFELPELKLLIDAVQSSRYLTEQKSRELIGKLCEECSVHDAQLMRRTIKVTGRVKSMNESIYHNIDYIQEAIAQDKQISFRYFSWDIDGQRKYRDKTYLASPYGICQDNDNCYLVSWTLDHGITHFRVDRMSHLRISEDPRIPCPELTGNAFNEYANRTFQMYAGETVNVKLRFHQSLINVVIDRFGREIMLIPEGEDWFSFTVPVAISPMFLSWVIGFGDKAKILRPESAVEACRALCRQALSNY
ncbi:MAG: transcriptional regulator [Oscillospiraceae bacterium]|nr:transcriptional regulator [Oscillospiraceae bacterium]